VAHDPSDYAIRRPRHTAAEGAPGHVWLKALSEPAIEPQQVQLIDFSRRGAKIELRTAIPPNCEVVLHIVHEALGLSIEIPGRVRWQRIDEFGRRHVGCHFDELVPYEVIGEMFLSGVLSTTAHSA
jgi:hypothetical protein